MSSGRVGVGCGVAVLRGAVVALGWAARVGSGAKGVLLVIGTVVEAFVAGSTRLLGRRLQAAMIGSRIKREAKRGNRCVDLIKFTFPIIAVLLAKPMKKGSNTGVHGVKKDAII
jgi:hypothetical protein